MSSDQRTSREGEALSNWMAWMQTNAMEQRCSSCSTTGAASLETERPNQVWPADFKGQFKTRDSRYCYPLTVTDHFGRTILLCKGLPSVRTEGAKPAFRRLFREVGLPEAIRTDNGVPFASKAIHGLCELKRETMCPPASNP